MMDELDPDSHAGAPPTEGDVSDLAPSFLAVMRGPNHVFTRANRAYMELVYPQSVNPGEGPSERRR